MEILFIVCLFVLNFACFSNLNYLSNTLSLYDAPDNIRKIHKYKIPKVGGLIFYLNYLLYVIFEFIKENSIEDLKLFFIITIFFLISLYNDKKDIKPSFRLIIFYFIFLTWILIDQRMLVNNLRFDFIELNYNLGFFSYLISPLFILIFFNALNLYDGVNLQSVTYLILFFIFFYLNGIDINNYYYFSIFILIFIYFNYKNKIFFGDSGIAVIAAIISYLTINNYNTNGNLFCEEIFLIMFLPGIDMMRVYFLRILKKKDPFKADNSHFHHYLQNIMQNKYIFLFQVLFYSLSLFLFYFLNFEFVLVIILMFLIYIFVIFFSNDKKNLS